MERTLERQVSNLELLRFFLIRILSVRSPEWRFIPESEKEELGLTFDDDGEFWMSFKDFQSHFDRLEICNLNPDSLTEDEVEEGNKKRWEVSFYEGEWVRGVTAGGCRNYLGKLFLNNLSKLGLYLLTLQKHSGIILNIE